MWHRSPIALLLGVIVVVSTAAPTAGSQQPNNAAPQISFPIAGNAPLLQFQAANHIVAFQAISVNLASADHCLTVEFVGAPGVQPVAGPRTLHAGTLEASTEMETQSLALIRVSYPNLWPGITVDYDAVEDGIAETTYTVSAGADVSAIRLRYSVPVQRNADGSLQFVFPSKRGVLTESAPSAWQGIAGERVAVPVEFTLSADGQVGFSVANHDSRYPLVIDPAYAWHTFYGMSGTDIPNGIAVDSSGNFYITGWSMGTWNGPGGEPPLNVFAGGMDLFVLKLNSSGEYQWHTFYGHGSTQAFGVAAEASGNIYITGIASDWNGPADQLPRHAHSIGSLDLLVLKLDSTGAYQWHTFYGKDKSAMYPYARAVTLDSNTNILVTGSSPEFAAPAPPVHAFAGTTNIFVLKLNSDGAYQWHTFYGSDNDQGEGIAADADGSIYVSANSNASWNGPNTTDSPLHAYAGGPDVAVLKLNGSGAYQWHTFYGSSKVDFVNRLTVDSFGDVIVVGNSESSWDGPGPASPLHTISDPMDAFVLKLSNGGAYRWHTFYGGSSGDELVGAVTDADGNIFATGYTYYSNWSGPDGQPPLHAFTDNSDIVVLKLNRAGAYQWHSFYGSAQSEQGLGIALDGKGDIAIAALSGATWEGPAGESPLHNYTGGTDITVLKIKRLATTTGLTSSVNPSTVGQTITFTATVSGSDGTSTGIVAFKEGSDTIPGCSAQPLSGGHATCSTSSLGAGTHNIGAFYNGDNNYGFSTSSVLLEVVNQAPTTTTLLTSRNPSPLGQSITFTATVTTANGTPTGTVNFKEGSSISGCSARLLTGGQATCTTSVLGQGSHSITAVYSGDANLAASTSSPLAQMIEQPKLYLPFVRR